MDAGLVDHYEKKHFEAARLSKCDAEQKEGNQLGYFKLATLFFILAIGMLSSSLAFLYELCCRQLQKHSTDHKSIYATKMPQFIQASPNPYLVSSNWFLTVQIIKFYAKNVEIMKGKINLTKKEFHKQ